MTDYTPERAARYADQIIILQSEIEEREEAIKNLKAKIGSFYEPGEYEEAGRKITVYHHKAINAAYAKKEEPALYEKGSKLLPTFNATTAKELLTPEEYARVQKVSPDLSVKVELLED